MRRLVCMGLVIVISLIFCACKRTDRPDPDAPITTVQQLADETTTSVPAHSELYLPEYTSQQCKNGRSRFCTLYTVITQMRILQF